MEPISEDKIKYFSKSIGSLVLLAPLLKKMKIAEIIDRMCPADEQQLLSHGKTIEILIANRLLSPYPLYKVENWAKNAGIKSLLNDDRIGKTLDVINGFCGEIKTQIAFSLNV